MSRTDLTITDWRRDPWDEPEDLEPEEMEPLPPERKGGRRLGLALLGLLVVMALLAGMAGRWTLQQVAPPGEPGDPVNFTVNEGDTLSMVADRLQTEGIITNARVFTTYIKYKGGLDLQPGYFTLRPRDDMGNIVKSLRTSPTQTFTNVTFPEGYAVARMGARLERDAPRLLGGQVRRCGHLRQDPQRAGTRGHRSRGPAVPGHLPGRRRARPRTQIVGRMAEQMTRVANSVGIQKAPLTTGRTPYEILIVASMIEKEAKVDEDRALIARVIYNRLFVGTPLQIDATLYYKQDSETPFSALRDLDTPYNSYLHLGLPPTPITNPSKKSIEAALNPAPNPDPASCPGGRALHLAVLRAGRRRGPPRLRHQLRRPPEERGEGAGRGPARVTVLPAARPVGGSTRVAGIIGWPVRHSLSPAMHNAAFAACELDWVYLAFPVPAGQAGAALGRGTAAGPGWGSR